MPSACYTAPQIAEAEIARFFRRRWLGFAFVCLDPAAPPLDEALGDFAALHAPWAMESPVTVRRRELEVACNWKLFPDGAPESRDQSSSSSRVTITVTTGFLPQ